MALPPLVCIEDLAAYLGIASFDGAALNRAEVVVADASAIVRAAAGLNWVTDGSLDADVPADVIAYTKQLAARMWANPTGVRQETTGPFSVSHGDLLDPAALERLGRFRSTSGLFTITTTGDDFDTGTVYLPVDPPGEPIPYLSDRDVI